MSAKRPRPAIPVLVHVDNPTDAASVTVDTSTIERKMDTVINNQERIYDKIPTSSGGGGGSADLTTVNEKTTALAETIGSVDSVYTDDNLIGKIKNLALSVGEYGGVLSESATGLRSLLYNVRQSVGDSTKKPSATGTTVRDLLAAIKTNTASGDDLTTVNEKITAINTAVGDGAVLANDQSLIGLAKGIKASLGSMSEADGVAGTSVKARLYNIQSSLGDAAESANAGKYNVKSLLYNIRTTIGNALTSASPANLTLRGLCMNVRNSIGDSTAEPTSTGTTVRDLLTAIKENTASGGGGGGGGGSADLTTVNEKTTSMAAAIGTTDSTYTSDDLLGRIKNLASSIGDFYLAPSATGSTVRDLLTAIKANTASGGGGGGGGSADLTTVNEKTTALAAAIGSASDDSSTVSVIGLLKSITDKY